jgi:hypothetical protein
MQRMSTAIPLKFMSASHLRICVCSALALLRSDLSLSCVCLGSVSVNIIILPKLAIYCVF